MNGENTNEVYKVLRYTSRLHDGKTGGTRVVPWNFTKFLVSTKFTTNEYFNPRAELDTVKAKIEEMLA